MRMVRGRSLRAEVERLAHRAMQPNPRAAKTAQRVVSDVRRRGDVALRAHAERWDGLAKGQALEVSSAEMKEALASVSRGFRDALETAARNIRQFCKWQMPREFTREIQPGVSVGQVIRPLDSVGCYVPGGRYPLPSSLLMTAIPAQVAGVARIAVASPRPARETLAAAALLGVERLFRIGGAQAIAAFAYGTESVPRVSKIAGPGNSFVTEAKKQVAFDCAIDMVAGPTEVVIVSDHGRPEFIASDLVAQAEHDAEAIAVFVTSCASLARTVAREVRRAARGNKTAEESLGRNGVILVAKSRAEALEIANEIAAEHITVSREDVPAITNAGSIFVGDYSPQAFGDYACGPNHVLPTGGSARFRGGLSVMDFVKIISVQEVSRPGLERAAAVVETLATAEGLVAHAESVRARCAHA
ncbi:MAG: histidinol dehydrogenase [Acidobacteriia bacterium]|nr:histidinol dehydrogenase [Terriglobia bacterium]